MVYHEKHPQAEMSTMQKQTCVLKHPRRQNVGAEMSIAKMSGAEMTPSHNGTQTVTVTHRSLSN